VSIYLTGFTVVSQVQARLSRRETIGEQTGAFSSGCKQGMKIVNRERIHA
jgi:hypothetical protein